MGKLVDFNDLHVTQGLDAVKAQLLGNTVDPAVELSDSDAAPPAPPEGEGPAETVKRLTLDQVLNRFALVIGKTHVWDYQLQAIMRKQAFIDLIGRDIHKRWNDHDERRLISENDVNGQQKKQGGDWSLLERYTYIYPTKDVWDNEKKELIPMDVLKVAIPSDFDWWLKHPRRPFRNKEQLVFDPTQTVDPSEFINTFTGLTMRPTDNEGWRCGNIRRLLASLCNNREDVIDWVTKWLAYPLQHIGAKMDTALLMHSGVQGSGKSLLFADICHQLYKPYSAVLGQHQLESQYTDWRSRLLFGVFEEVFSRDQKYSHVGTIKHMISGKTQRIEKKFLSSWEEANHMNAVFLSNEFQPWPIEPSDRRMLVVWPENTLGEGEQFLVSEELLNDGIPAFLEYLMNYDLEDFNPHTKPLMTPEKERLIEFGLPGQDVFYQEWSEGELEIPYISCIVDELYAEYERWCRKAGERILSRKKFVAILKTKERHRRCWFVEGNFDKRQRRFFIVGQQPGDLTEQEWLGKCVRKFREKAQGGEDQLT